MTVTVALWPSRPAGSFPDITGPSVPSSVMVSVFPDGAAPASAHAGPMNANENATNAAARKLRKNMGSPSGKAARSLHELWTGQGATREWPCCSQRVFVSVVHGIRIAQGTAVHCQVTRAR
jgi:hypothetical protein